MTTRDEARGTNAEASPSSNDGSNDRSPVTGSAAADAETATRPPLMRAHPTATGQEETATLANEEAAALGHEAMLSALGNEAMLSALGNEAVLSALGNEATLPAPEDAGEAVVAMLNPNRPERSGTYSRGELIGRYVVLDLLGRGGMGAVYAAYDPELDRRVAVKLLRTARARENSRKRLVREARALAKLSHPNVVQVYDAGVHEGNVFIAMELVAGTSLREWVQSKPVWQEVLAVYLDAAQGLAAAHQSGLVHRDIKPANILRGNDGRVRVADFGLAAAVQRDGEETPGVSGEELSGQTDGLHASLQGRLDERLTVAGSIMGTPAYMAPEQHLSADVGPAADQYSLCVSLYEALYGRLPFVAEDRRSLRSELMDKKLRGQVPPPPSGSPVPAWVFQALRRGLAASPDERYPSLDALIAALRSDPRARRRARVRTATLACTTLALVVLAALGWARSGAFDDPCEPEKQRLLLAGAWDEGVRARINAALQATGKPYAADTAARVSTTLDAYADAWVSMRTEVCHAQEASKEARELLVLRTVCLERRRSQLRALTEVLSTADATVLDKAAAAARALYPISYCADERALTARLPPPEDPALRRRVEALQPRVDRIEALHESGKYREGLEEAERLRTEVAEIAYAPLRAEAAFWLARMRTRTGDDAGALPLLQESQFLASQSGDDALAARALGLFVYILGYRQQKLDEALALVTWIHEVVDHTPDELARAYLLNILAVMFEKAAKYEEARATGERALAIRERILGPEHPDVGTSLYNLHIPLSQLGRLEEARAMCERALAIREKAFGPEHPSVASSLSSVAILLMRDMRPSEEANALLERARIIQEKALGPEHFEVAVVLNYQGANFSRTGNYDKAKPMYERALAIFEKALGPGHADTASPLNNLAGVLAALGRREEATAMYERALAVWEKALGPEHPDLLFPLAGLGRTLLEGDPKSGDIERAARHLKRAQAISEKAMAPENPRRADTLLGLAELALARKQPQVIEDAIRLLEESLSIDDGSYRAEIQLALAEALWRTADKGDASRAESASDIRARAVDTARQAREHSRKIGHQAMLAKAERWLASHPLP